MLDRDKEAACKVVSKMTRTIKKPELLKDTREGFDHWAGPPVVAKGDTEPKNVKNAEHDCSKTHPDMTHEMWTEVEKKKKQEKKADDADTMKALAILTAIGGGGGAGIGGIANALSGDSVGRGMLTGGLTGLGATAGLLPGLIGGGFSGAKLQEAGLNPFGDSHMGAILGVGAGGALGAGAGGLGGYRLAQALQRDEEEEKMGSAQRCLELGRGSSLTKSAAPPTTLAGGIGKDISRTAGAPAGTGGFFSNVGKSIGDVGRSVGSALSAAGRGAAAGLKSAPKNKLLARGAAAAAGGMQGWNMARQRQATSAANQVTPAQTRAAANRDSQRPTPPVMSGAASSPYGPAGVGWNLKQDERRILEKYAPAGQPANYLDQYNDKTPTPQPPAPATVPFGTAQVAKVNTDTTPRQSVKAIELPPTSTSVFDPVDPNSPAGRALAPSTTADDALKELDQTQRQLRRRRPAGGGVSSAMEAGRARPSNSNLPNGVSGPLNDATRRSSSPGQPSQSPINPISTTTGGGGIGPWEGLHPEGVSSGIDTAGLDAGVNRSMDKYNTPPAGNFGDIPEGADISAEVPGVQAGTGSRDERSVTHRSNLGRAGTPEFRRGKRGASAMQLAEPGSSTKSVRAANRRNARLLEEEGKLKRRKKKSRKSKKKKTDYKGVDSKMASIQYNGDLLKYANALLEKQAATAYSSARRPSNLRRGLPKRRPSSTTPPEQQSGSQRRSNFLSGATGRSAQTRQEKRDAQTVWQLQNSKRKRDRRTHGAISNSASKLVGQGYSPGVAMRMAQDQHSGGVDPSPGRSDSRLNSSTQGAIARNKAKAQMSGASPRRKRQLQSRNRKLQGHIDRRADRAQQVPATRAMAQGRPAPAGLDMSAGMLDPQKPLPKGHPGALPTKKKPGWPDLNPTETDQPGARGWPGGPRALPGDTKQTPAKQTPVKQTPVKPPVYTPTAEDRYGPGYDPAWAEDTSPQPLSDDQFLAQHGNTPLGALTAEQRQRRTDIAAGRQSSRQQAQTNQANVGREQHLRDMSSSWPSAQVTGPRGRKFTVGVDSPQHPQHSLYQKAVGWADQGKDPRRVFWDHSAPRTQDASGKVGPRGQSFGPSRYEHPYAKAYQGYMQQHGKDNKFRYQDIEGYQKPKPLTTTGASLNLNEPGSVGGPLPGGSVLRTGAPTTPDF